MNGTILDSGKFVTALKNKGSYADTKSDCSQIGMQLGKAKNDL